MIKPVEEYQKTIEFSSKQNTISPFHDFLTDYSDQVEQLETLEELGQDFNEGEQSIQNLKKSLDQETIEQLFEVEKSKPNKSFGKGFNEFENSLKSYVLKNVQSMKDLFDAITGEDQDKIQELQCEEIQKQQGKSQQKVNHCIPSLSIPTLLESTHNQGAMIYPIAQINAKVDEMSETICILIFFIISLFVMGNLITV